MTFAKLGKNLKAYQDFRLSLESRLKGAMTFYGWTAVTTTDIGVNPFDPVYYNVGTHASVANTILSRSFLNELPTWISLVIGALLSLVLWFVLGKLKTLAGVSVGFASFVALMAAIGAFYAATGIFPGALGPGLTVFLTVLGLTLMKFWGSEAEKRYIRGAFSTYLSPDVIKELEADPDKLKLGGEKKLMTAMFTDVKGFSTISESLDPNELVTLLNQYLTSMSDIILDAAGTIDKYEGDAIIAFWGAPLSSERHAQSAVESALLMKKAEAAMNERFAREKLHPGPLLTRIGINTGDMTVGNMGTERRMNYTMMGNAVNLAARLEGVNKQYGTWILTSQATRDDSGRHHCPAQARQGRRRRHPPAGPALRDRVPARRGHGRRSREDLRLREGHRRLRDPRLGRRPAPLRAGPRHRPRRRPGEDLRRAHGPEPGRRLRPRLGRGVPADDEVGGRGAEAVRRVLLGAPLPVFFEGYLLQLSPGNAKGFLALVCVTYSRRINTAFPPAGFRHRHQRPSQSTSGLFYQQRILEVSRRSPDTNSHKNRLRVLFVEIAREL